VKAWINASIGNGKPLNNQWPEAVKERYREDTGNDLQSIAKCMAVNKAVLETYPDLNRLTDDHDRWAELQFIESQAVIATMLYLKRTHSVPSLSVYDALIAPSSKASLVHGVLSTHYEKVVGVKPILTIKRQGRER
jgi:hypothetical protein